MAHAQKPDFAFRRNGRVHLNRQGASVQSTTGIRVVRINGNNAGYTMFRGSRKNTGYPLHSPVYPSLPLSCVTVCHHISTGLYTRARLICLHTGDTGNCEYRQVTRVLFALSSVLNVGCEMLFWTKNKKQKTKNKKKGGERDTHTHTHTNFTLVVRQGISTRRGQLKDAVLSLWRFLTDLANGSIQMTFS